MFKLSLLPLFLSPPHFHHSHKCASLPNCGCALLPADIPTASVAPITERVFLLGLCSLRRRSAGQNYRCRQWNGLLSAAALLLCALAGRAGLSIFRLVDWLLNLLLLLLLLLLSCLKLTACVSGLHFCSSAGNLCIHVCFTVLLYPEEEC